MKSVFINADNHLRNGWKVLGAFLLTGLFVVGLIFLRRLLPASVRALLPEPLLAFVGALLATWLCTRLERTSLAAQGFALDVRAGRHLGLGVAGGMGLVGLVALVGWLLGGFHWVRTPDAAVSGLLKAAGTMLAVALFEETLFRGYAFQRAIRGLGARWAQVLFAAIFTLAHSLPPGMDGGVMAVAMLNIFLAGLMLGLCYLRTGSLALPVGVHLGWNWMQGSLGFGVSGKAASGWWTPVLHDRPEWLTGGAFGLEASVISVVVMGLTVLGLSRYHQASICVPTVQPRVLSP
ncbi:CPBP family intramembrane glutamic endopeptidase [Pyxidicoccus sp. 3LFB2]